MTTTTDTLRFEGATADWKLVYRALHAHLTEHVELMDSPLFEELQARLQYVARAEGVDVTDHAAWDAWLGNTDAPPCEERLRNRRPITEEG